MTRGSSATGIDPPEGLARLRSLRAMAVLNNRHWRDIVAALRLAEIETCVSINSEFEKMLALTYRHLFESCFTTFFGDARGGGRIKSRDVERFCRRADIAPSEDGLSPNESQTWRCKP